MRRYSSEEKANALKLAEEIGAPKAANELGISYASLLAWRKDNNTKDMQEDVQDTPEDTQEAAVPSVVPDSTEVSDIPSELPPELQVQLLRQENAQLKARLAQQARAIHELTPIEE